jgi:hypothetical protein
VTIANNTANTTAAGGGIQQGDIALNLKSTLVASNGSLNCNTNVASNGYNLSTDSSCFASGGTDKTAVTDPKLGPLQDNGGPTLTHALLPGSPAIDTASPTCPPPATDQRGVSRPQGPACDIGAYEAVAAPAAAAAAQPPGATPSAPGIGALPNTAADYSGPAPWALGLVAILAAVGLLFMLRLQAHSVTNQPK